MGFGKDILMSSSVTGNIDVTVYGTSGKDSLQTVLLQMPQSSWFSLTYKNFVNSYLKIKLPLGR